MTNATTTAHVLDGRISVRTAAGVSTFAVREMPEEFLAWQLGSRLAMFERMARAEQITDFHAHLPVVATFNEELEFPVHTATKATGLLPRKECLEDYVVALSRCLQEVAAEPWEQTQARRVSAARGLYENPEHIDRRMLGLVEIFQGQTYRNLVRTPLMAAQYTGAGPEYRSYQINGVVEMIGSDDRRFAFLHLMRQLFEYNAFHVQQPAYPSGYVLWISEVFDKSPRGRAGRRIR